MRLITFKCKDGNMFAFPVDQIFVYTAEKYINDEENLEKETLITFADLNSHLSRTIVIDESFEDVVDRINDVLDPIPDLDLDLIKSGLLPIEGASNNV